MLCDFLALPLQNICTTDAADDDTIRVAMPCPFPGCTEQFLRWLDVKHHSKAVHGQLPPLICNEGDCRGLVCVWVWEGCVCVCGSFLF